MNFLPAAPGLGLGHFTFLELPPQDLVRLAARTGYARVGLRLHPVVPGGLAYPLPAGGAGMRALKVLLAGEGVAVYDVESVVIDAAFDPESLKPIIASAAELGAKVLNTCADDDDRERLLSQFARICDMAEEAGMAVDIECMAWRGIDSLGKCADLVRDSGKANASVLVDALHLSRCGGTPAEVAALPAAMVRNAQLCDAPSRQPATAEAIMAEARGGRLPPGDGGLPLAGLVAALPARTVFSVEVPMAGQGDPESRARAIFEGAMKILAQR